MVPYIDIALQTYNTLGTGSNYMSCNTHSPWTHLSTVKSWALLCTDPLIRDSMNFGSNSTDITSCMTEKEKLKLLVANKNATVECARLW